MARKHTMDGFFIALPVFPGKRLIRMNRIYRMNDKETYAYRHHRRRPRRSLLRA
jgi:hypothetical protein